jgi:hypothetical protein
MKLYRQICFLGIAFSFVIGLSVINSCSKGGDQTPTPAPNPCSGITITVSGTVTNTTTGQSVGAINATASGSSSFTYSLNGGAFQASGSFTALAAGTYTVTAKNADGCTGSNSFTVNDPCSIKNITISATVVNTILGTANGSINATASGSTGFTYNINGGAFQGTGNFTGLAIGAYTIVAKDFEGCLKSQVFNVQDICAAKNIAVTGTVVNAGPGAGASNGSINASASGSTGFTYQLNSGAFQSSGNFAGLTAANYTVTAKDLDGCLKSQPFTVTLDPCIGKTLTISASTTAVDKCAGSPNGSVTITAGGGVGFTYNLSGGAFQASNIFTGLSANNYTTGAKDADGCIKTGTAVVSLAPAGTTFSAVKAVLLTNCAISGCHLSPSPQNGLDFSIDCTIVGAWDRIKARAVDANPSQMPPAPNPVLNGADKQKILDWIAAGHRFVD